MFRMNMAKTTKFNSNQHFPYTLSYQVNKLCASIHFFFWNLTINNCDSLHVQLRFASHLWHNTSFVSKQLWFIFHWLLYQSFQLIRNFIDFHLKCVAPMRNDVDFYISEHGICHHNMNIHRLEIASNKIQ